MARDPNTPKASRPKKKPKNKDVVPPPERIETPEVRLPPHLRIVSRRQSARPPGKAPIDPRPLTSPVPARPSSQERAERKRKAKGERRAKGEPLLREDGDKKCKICKEVSALAA